VGKSLEDMGTGEKNSWTEQQWLVL
jgi:hypothetical protein